MRCFKSYDVRAPLGEDFNPKIAGAIACAFSDEIQAQKIAIGCDIRLSSPEIKSAMIEQLLQNGIRVIDLGMTGTEEVYFASMSLDVDGGIEVTASHNPENYNGLKFIKRAGVPLSSEELLSIKDKVASEFTDNFSGKKGLNALKRATLEKVSVCKPYTDFLLKTVALENLAALKIVVNAGHGAAGHVIDELEAKFQAANFPITFYKIYHEPNGHFPVGVPNPMVKENQRLTADAVKQHQADLGIAWDGDFDRCFFFDETGAFVEGYYIVGLLAEAFLRKNRYAKIVHDPRLKWNTTNIVEAEGGFAIQSRTGHAFIKQKMREVDAVYGGEMSAHHYFKDFGYCDSGMLPWLYLIQLLSMKQQPLSKLVAERISRFPCSGEINFKVADAKAVIKRIRDQFQKDALEEEHIDGLSMSFKSWRFNLRASNTEPLLRLNVESKGDPDLVHQKTDEIANLIQYLETSS